MSVSISNYVAGRSNWVASVLRQLLDNGVLIETDEVDFSAKDGSVCCTIDILHTMFSFDFKRINDILNERCWAVNPSSWNYGYTVSFNVTEGEL